jgi:hypothetical protein
MRFAFISDIHANLPAQPHVTMIRVRYDVERAVRAIKKSPLPDELADRLRRAY